MNRRRWNAVSAGWLGIALLSPAAGDRAAVASPGSSGAGKNVVMVIGEDQYGTETSLPVFASKVLEPLGLRCTVILADPADANRFPGLEKSLEGADLVILSVRRRTLSDIQLKTVRSYIASGRPAIGIRTASHGFSLSSGEPRPGLEQWRGFDREVLGGRYDGHYPNRAGTEVAVKSEALGHPVVADLETNGFHSSGTLYKYPEMADGVTLLLEGSTMINGMTVKQPVAWVRNRAGQRIFYTSLGHRDDFSNPTFVRLLSNAVKWALDEN